MCNSNKTLLSKIGSKGNDHRLLGSYYRPPMSYLLHVLLLLSKQYLPSHYFTEKYDIRKG